MSTSITKPAKTNAADVRGVFDDPVTYLASFGISAVIVSDSTALPKAA